MGLVAVGISHRTAPLELRERLSIPKDKLKAALRQLHSTPGLQEAVVLSTCNRMEIYARPEDQRGPAVAALKQFFTDVYGHKHLAPALYSHEGIEAVRHLFRVSAGLDSMVIGETEILGQVKHAYLFAHAESATGKITNVLFQRALFVGKQVRVETEISEGSSSVGSVAVQLALKIFDSLKDRRVAILGAGEMAEVTARHLLSQKISDVVVLNRTVSNAEKLANMLGGRALPLDDVKTQLLEADIVICSASSHEPLITKQAIEELMDARQNRSLYFVDIAVPRNVAAEVHDLDNVYVYNIDDLKNIVDENIKKRKMAIDDSETLVNIRADEFYAWIQGVLKGKNLASHQNSRRVEV